MRRFKNIDKEHWWITAHTIDDLKRSGFTPLALARKREGFADARQAVWQWYRSEVAGNESLSMSARFVCWALCERWRYETWSSHDAVSYYAKMTAVNRKSVGKAIAELSEHELIWIVLEGSERVRLRKSQASGRKHFLLVGLADLVERA